MTDEDTGTKDYNPSPDPCVLTFAGLVVIFRLPS